ncbi:MAG: hypothetical protein H6841_09010 [Planctomycetes bacterium]|nr:hypothetical protein [Planctomycetota bacterium]MCB9934862.1 hypothetical protein [Planctomycetota bacterium]
MAGTPQQPYGTPPQPVPEFAPQVGRQPGSLAPKVWGIILLILGVLGFVLWLVGIVSLGGGGMSGSSFAPNMSPEAKAELDRIAQVMVENMKGRWSFWLNNLIELSIIVLSLVAGTLLVIKPKPVGRKLAIARALVVLLALPIAGYEGFTALDENMEMQIGLQKIQAEDMIKQEEARSPSKNDKERADRRQRIERTFDSVQPIMRGAGYGFLIFSFICVLILNGLLLLFMTRPAVKDYMDNVAKGAEQVIPGYDPSMGYASGPPPGYGPPPDSPQ